MMQTPDPAPTAPSPIPSCRKLRRPIGRARAGYRIGGVLAGPTVIVFAHGAAARGLFLRLVNLPSLAHLRGRLFLLYEDQIDLENKSDAIRAMVGRNIDATLALPPLDDNTPSGELPQDDEKSAYWDVLRFCASLGMIDGRGVPPKPSISPSFAIVASHN